MKKSEEFIVRLLQIIADLLLLMNICFLLNKFSKQTQHVH